MGRARIIADLVGFSTDSGVLNFGADKEITLTHDPDDGLILKHAATADDSFPELTFQTGDTDIAVNDLLGRINFQAPDEGAGTDAILVAGAIAAISEGDFSSSANATSLIFQTGASETATTKMTLSSGGNLDVTGDITGSTLNADGDTAAGDNAAIGFTSTEGLILTGQGSTNDVTIKNDADADVIEIPTGTVNVTMAGTLGVTGALTAAGVTSNVGGDVSMSNDAAGQLKINGSGYDFGIALDATAAHLYHNSGARDLILGVNETEQMRLTPAGLLKFDSGFGSVATAYGVRAWVSFNGTGTVAILNSGNVSSITDNGTGDYTINFSANMPDDDYVMANAMLNSNGGFIASIESASNKAVGSCRIKSHRVNYAFTDLALIDLTFTR